MSAGPFLDAFYTTNKGAVLRIRVQPQTAALVVGGVTNTIPSGTGALAESANVSSRNRRGVNARKVGIKLNAAPAGTEYVIGSPIYIPWFDPETFPDPRQADKSATYLGVSATFIGTSPERTRN